MSQQTKSLKRHLLKRTCICCFCRRKLTYSTATIEHILPKSEGGKLTKLNVAISCSNCNEERGVIDFVEFRDRKRAAIKAISQRTG